MYCKITFDTINKRRKKMKLSEEEFCVACSISMADWIEMRDNNQISESTFECISKFLIRCNARRKMP